MFAFQMTPVVRVLLFLNIGLYAAEQLVGIPLSRYFTLYHVNHPEFQPFQVVTYCFMHDQQDWTHLLSNMIGLFFFGPFIERQITSKRFLQLYLFCGIAVGLLGVGIQYLEIKKFEQETVYTMENPTPENVIKFVEPFPITPEFRSLLSAYQKEPTNPHYIQNVKEGIRQIAKLGILGPGLVGASGAIFGLFMVMFLLFPNLELRLLFPPIPIKAKYLVGALGLYELYRLMQNAPGDNVSHFSHLAGMLFAFIMIKLVWKMSRVY
ncbi:MAG: rhomboid family intramembrane serine protease [Flammeovirgaceae bacterium]